MRHHPSPPAYLFLRRIFGLLMVMWLGHTTVAASEFTAQEHQRVIALNESLLLFDRDYQVQLREFSVREQDCLSKFISASCLDELRRDAAQARRQYELAKELLRRDIRQIEADVRYRQRLEADAVRTQRLGELVAPKAETSAFASGKVRLD